MKIGNDGLRHKDVTQSETMFLMRREYWVRFIYRQWQRSRPKVEHVELIIGTSVYNTDEEMETREVYEMCSKEELDEL